MALPPTGARLILATEGLWDAVSIKDACHFAKGMHAAAAAHQACPASAVASAPTRSIILRGFLGLNLMAKPLKP